MRDKTTHELCDKDLKSVSHHVLYEVGMFIHCTRLIQTGRFSGAINNALLESRAVHLRSLADFLTENRKQPDDIVAGDFFIGDDEWPAQRSDVLKSDVRQASKQIAHLTRERIGLEADPSRKQWSMTGATYEEIVQLVRRWIEKIPSHRLCSCEPCEHAKSISGAS